MNLLITGAWQQAKEYMADIRAMGNESAFLQFEKDPLPCDGVWVEGIIGNGIFLSHPIETFPNLRYVQLTSAGFDRVPMDYIRAHKIHINNARGVYSIPMAEFAVGGVLQLYKQFRSFSESKNRRLWEKRRDLQELSGKTVAVIGCGSVGTECAKRFRAFDAIIRGVDLFVREDRHYDSMVGLEELDATLEEADVVVLTVPLTDETRYLMNAQRLNHMRSQAILVNISRGAVVETAALIDALKHRLGGAVLDVFETEPLPAESPLWDMENVVLTPHNSFVGEGNGKRMSDVIISGLRDLRAAGAEGENI